MGDFEIDTKVEGADGRYRARLSRDWEIWGPSGGYVAAIALRAAGAQTELGRPASFAGHFLGVADFEAVDVGVQSLRRTKRAESLRVTMTQEGRPVFEALVWAIGDVGGIASVWSQSGRLLATGGQQMLWRPVTLRDS